LTGQAGDLRSDGRDPSAPLRQAPTFFKVTPEIHLPMPGSIDPHVTGEERSRFRAPALAKSGKKRDTILWRRGRVDLQGSLYKAWRNGRTRPGPGDLMAPLLSSPRARLIIFVLDVSDSMFAGVDLMQLWITDSMGEAYLRRDPVAIITVQGQGAQLLVHPTTSPHFALQRLSTVKVGGATPLDQGLIMTRRVIAQWLNRYPIVDLVIITDGRSTSSLSNPPVTRAIDTVLRLTRRIILINPLPEADPFAQGLATLLGARLVSLTSLNRDIHLHRGCKFPS